MCILSTPSRTIPTFTTTFTDAYPNSLNDRARRTTTRPLLPYLFRLDADAPAFVRHLGPPLLAGAAIVG